MGKARRKRGKEREERRIKQVPLEMDVELVQRIDGARGLIPRAVFLRELINKALDARLRVE